MNSTVSRMAYITLLTVACSACSSQHDSKTEKHMIETLTSHRTDDVTSVDLNGLLPAGWSKLCVQMPQMPSEIFEEFSGTKLKNYKVLTDDSILIMWVLYPNQEPTYMNIPRKTVMDFNSATNGTRDCSADGQTTMNLVLVPGVGNGAKSFNFN
jgi:hypothetical protein